MGKIVRLQSHHMINTVCDLLHAFAILEDLVLSRYTIRVNTFRLPCFVKDENNIEIWVFLSKVIWVAKHLLPGV